MTSITRYNFKVLIYDPDTYARHAIYTFLAWDRRTRVTFRAKSLEDLWQHLRTAPVAERPDYIVLDANHLERDLLLPQHFFERSFFRHKGVIDAVKIETYRRR